LTHWANGISHRLTQQMMWQMFRAADNRVRTQVLQMARSSTWGPFAVLQKQTRSVLYGFSPQVIPRPSDWPESIYVTGYWFLEQPAEWVPPSDLVHFLQAGPPPIYVGFGSMSSNKAQENTAIVVQSLSRSGQRGVLASGWGGLKTTTLPETVFMVGSIPHSWLFPQMAAVVHHGGAGTTAAGLAAGIPSILTPYFGDQPFWGRRVYELGVGPRPIPHRQLTSERLAEAIRIAVHDEAVRINATRLGERIRAENGIAKAVAVIEQC
jgi:sterol 3beta-glucosyltransferase